MNKVILLLIAIQMGCLNAQSQSGMENRPAWTANPFDHSLFIKNEGQFADKQIKDKIQYVADLGNMKICFTDRSVVYCYSEYKPNKKEKKEGSEKAELEREQKERNARPGTHYFSQEWQNTNPDVGIDGLDSEPYSIIYGSTEGKEIRTRACRKIVYKNLYPGIDAAYYFKPNEAGLKYDLIIHPGADIGAVKLRYVGGKRTVLQQNGDITLQSALGEFTDHTPETYYDDGTKVKSEYVLNGKEVSFRVENYDAGKTSIIDPWTTNPNIPGGWNANLAYDVDYDNYGNVYALGSYYPFILVKFNPAGVILWKYIAPATFSQSYGDFAIDRVTGNSYIVAGTSTGGFNMGSQVLKVSTNGTLLASHPGVANGMYEMWRTVFDPCAHQLIVAGGGVYNTTQALAMDTNLNIVVNPQNVLNATLQGGTSFHDMCMMSLDPLGGSCYMGATKSNVNPGFDDLLCKVPLSALSPTIYKTPLGFPYVLREGYLNGYVLGTVSIGNPNSFSNALNGMAASPNWVYVCDGTTLTKYNKNSGAIIASNTVYNWMFPGSKDSVRWSGIDVDLCDNAYVGVKNAVQIYNSNLVLTQTIPLTDTVFDVKVGKNNLLYACGKGFVSAVTITGSTAVITHTSTPVSACSACNGTATASLSICGNPANGATYSWSTNPIQTTQTAVNLCPGTYTVTAKLGCGMVFTDTVNLIAPGGAVTISTQTVTSVSCSGGNNGSATVAANGGLAPYSFNWSNGQTTATATNLIAGTYTCTVTDAHGCSDHTVVTVNQPTPIHLNMSSTPVHCNLNDGTAGVAVTGGISPYTYLWSNGQTSAAVNNLSGNVYTVTVTDANACTQTNTVSILPSTGLSYTLTPGILNCFGDTTSVHIAVTSLTNYTVSWNTNPVKTGLAVHGIGAGNYSGTITDSAGCVTNFSFTLVQPIQIIPSFSVNTACFGNALQFTDLSSGGPFIGWSWNFGDGGTAAIQNPQHSYLTTGIFTVTLTVNTNNGCSASITHTVTIAPLVQVVFSADSVCFGNVTTFSDHSAGVSAGSNYNWSFGDGGSSTQALTVTHLYQNSGVFTTTLTISNSLGCVSSGTLHVLIKQLPVVNLVNSPEYCPGQLTNSIHFTSTPGGNSSGFFWTNMNLGIGLSQSGSGNLPVFTTINTGSVSVSATLLVHAVYNGCTGPDSMFNITINPNPEADFSAQHPVCLGSPTQLTDISSGIITSWNWDLDHDGIYSDATIKNPIYTFPTAGTQSVALIVTSNKNCKDTVEKNIYINPLPQVNFTGGPLSGCPMLNTSFTDHSTIPAPSHITGWSWDFGNGTMFSGQFPPTISYTNLSHTQVASYTVSLLVTSDSGCTAKLIKPNFVQVYPRPRAEFSYTSDINQTDGIDPTVHFFDQSVGASTVHWNLGDVFSNPLTLNNASILNPTHIYLNEQEYTYYVTEWVTNVYGCVDSITKPVELKPGFTFYIPNAFTPNGDNLNEGFKGTGIGIDNSTYNLLVFDRWGNLIFKSNDLEKAWNGTVNGKGDVVQEDVYVWKVDFNDFSGMKHEYKGTVSLIK